MNTANQPILKMTLPTQKEGEHLVVETRTEALANWLKRLPYGNMAKTLPSIRQSISGFNRTSVSLSNRLNNLALYDRSYQLVANYYRPKSFHKDKRQAKVSREEKMEFYLLTQEMAYGYKLLALEMDKIKGPCQAQANILNLTIYYLSLVMMSHYDVYAPTPSNIWREIHSILNYAVYHNLIENKLPPSAPSGCLQTIEKTYLRITLIALINPYHLNQGQHWPIWKYLSYWVKVVELSDDIRDYAEEFTFIAELEGDQSPKVKDISVEQVDLSNTLLLLSKDLIIQIKKQLVQLKSEGKPPLPGFGSEVNASRAKLLLEAMYDHWQGSNKRILPRANKPQKLSLVAGLKNIHADISQSDLFFGKKAHSTSLSTISRWHQINTCTGGLCINTSTLVKNISVGQLIAIQKESPQDEYLLWKLAVIRWLQSNRQQGTTLGIEWLAGEIQPVEIKILGIDQRQELGFLISGEEVMGQTKPTLIYPQGSLPDKHIVILQIGDEELAISITKKITETFYFDRAFYRTRELSEAEEIANKELADAEEAKKRLESGEEHIEMTILPGFGQSVELHDNPLEKPAHDYDKIKKSKY